MAKSPSAPSRSPAASQRKAPPQPRTSTAASGAKGKASATPKFESDTDGEEDEIYALVSVLYHALQGASASRKYISDAETAEDQGLVEFFQRCLEDDRSRAKEAKRLLVARVDEEDDEEGAGDDDSADEDDDEEEDEEDEDDEDDEDEEK